jgi:uncharacterized protein (DUF2249 family)
MKLERAVSAFPSCRSKARVGIRSQSCLADRRSAAKGAAMSQIPGQSAVKEIDVRTLVPAQRHEKIFQLVDTLTAGASFILVNDHDPKPLYYQIEAEHPKEFSWTYLEKGPVVWRVEIGKLSDAA